MHKYITPTKTQTEWSQKMDTIIDNNVLLPYINATTVARVETKDEIVDHTPKRFRLKFNTDRKTYELIGDMRKTKNRIFVEIETGKGVYCLRTMPCQSVNDYMSLLDKPNHMFHGVLWQSRSNMFNPIRNCMETYGSWDEQLDAIQLDILNWVLAQPPQKDQLQMIHDAERENVSQTFQQLDQTLSKK